MPLTALQAHILKLLTGNRSPESHLAGAAGIHLSPESLRYSHDLDLFHPSARQVAEAYAKDVQSLQADGIQVQILLSQPGFIRVQLVDKEEPLLIDWAVDSTWRFFPTVCLEDVGWVLHPVDLAVNKILALVGREEVRDLVDALTLHKNVLPLGALIWAACGKDPGLNPRMLLELLQRKGRVTETELNRLDLKVSLTPAVVRNNWNVALKEASRWISQRLPDEMGCLYTKPNSGLVFAPEKGDEAIPLYGKPGGVLPRIDGVPIKSFTESPELQMTIEQFFHTKMKED